MAGQIFTHYKVGLQNVGSYQASGKPFASGSIDAVNRTVNRISRLLRVGYK
jgi:hypothetical protein